MYRLSDLRIDKLALICLYLRNLLLPNSYKHNPHFATKSSSRLETNFPNREIWRQKTRFKQPNGLCTPGFICKVRNY